MFEKPPQKLSPPPDANISVETIPSAFYGGNDPVIYAEPEVVAAPKKIVPPVVPAQRAVVPPPAVSQTKGVSPLTPAHTMSQPQKSSSKFMWLGGGAVLLLLIGGALWWFLGNNTEAPVVMIPEPVPPIVAESPASEPDVATPTVATSTEEDVVTEAPSLAPIPLDFPTVFLADSADQDTDSLTDSEEEMLGTDSGIWDTDKDGYYDGQEVFHLYNPIGFAPVKIIDSGLVKEYVNPTWQYRMYYPATWEIGAVDSSANQVLVSSVSGDYVEIRAMPKQTGETFFDWFARVAVGQVVTDIEQSKNRFEEVLSIRKDSLVGYLDQGGVVYVVLYHPSKDGPIAFRHMMQLMLQSFRPGKTPVVLPEQPILPVPPSTPAVQSITTSPNVTTSTTMITTTTTF